MPPGGFRTAYTTQGVSGYYTNNSTTYRNPHFPGVVKCIHTILDRILLSGSGKVGVGHSSSEVVVERDTGERADGVGLELELGEGADGVGLELELKEEEKEEKEERNVKKPALTVFDLAAGGGEATIAVREWVRKVVPELVENVGGNENGIRNEEEEEEEEEGENEEETGREVKRRKRIGDGGGLKVYASDPFTYALYEERVNGVRRQVESGVGVGRVGEGREGEGEGEGEDRDSREDGKGDEEVERGGNGPIATSTMATEKLSQGKEGREGVDDGISATIVGQVNSNDLPISTTLIPQTITTTTTTTTTTAALPPYPYPYIPCHPFSFRDIPLQGLDTLLLPSSSTSHSPLPLYIDITIISFALHLCPPSELFSLLYELCRHSAYLVVIAPHKNPHIPGRAESGWVGPVMEVLVKKERVRGRVFRSVLF